MSKCFVNACVRLTKEGEERESYISTPPPPTQKHLAFNLHIRNMISFIQFFFFFLHLVTTLYDLTAG